MYLVLDTETSGLFNFKLPANDPSQPRLASIAMLSVDNSFNIVSACYGLIKPLGWAMTDGATRCNGLTDEMLYRYGANVSDSLNMYTDSIKKGCIVVSFNAQFDLKVMRSELRRAEMDDLFTETKNLCLMRLYTDICKMPYKTKREGYKFPKLSEACQSVGIPFTETHNALADTMPLVELMRRYKELSGQKLPDPQVYHHPKYDEIKNASS